MNRTKLFSKKLKERADEHEKKKATNTAITHILHIFLPLDIDMQALEMIQNDGEKAKKYLHGDKEIEGLFQSRKSDKYYLQKLFDLWYLLGEKGDSSWKPSSEAEKLTPLGDLKNNTDLCKLAGLANEDPKKSQIYKFLASIDTGKRNGKDVTDDYFCEPFNNLDKEIKTFHGWYCALVKCLRGEEGCKN